MIAYFSRTRTIFLDEGEFPENVVQQMIEEIQAEEPKAELNSMHQSLVAGGLVGRDRLVITIIMETEVFKH